MHRGGPYWLPPRRAPFGRSAGQPSEGAPTGAALTPRARQRSRSPFTAAGRRVASFGGLSQNQHPRVLRSSPLQGHAAMAQPTGTKLRIVAAEACGAVFGQTGTGPRRVVRLPTADSLCDRMERGEEEAIYGPPRCISAQPFLQTSRPVGFRRAAAGKEMGTFLIS